MYVRRAVPAVLLVLCCSFGFAQVASQNINMVSGTAWPAGDPYLQRQNEPSMAVSSRNPEHILAGSNDYRTVDIPNPQAANILGDAWLSVYTSLDGGDTWKSTLLPGYPQDTSAAGTASPLHAFTVATDPTVRAGTNGMFYYSGLVFNRANNSPSGVFVATFQDQNNKGNGDAALLQTNANGTTHGNPFAYVGVSLVDTGTSGQFLDKPWVAVDIPRPGRTATCKINGVSFNSGYVYVVYTQFNGSMNNPSSKIKEVTSTDCGQTWSKPQVLSQSQKLAQGTVATIDPTNGNVMVAWRQIAIAGNMNQLDAIQWAISTNGGWSFTYEPAAYTFTSTSTSNPYPQGSVFDQPQASSTTFRTLDVPSIAVDNTGRTWLAFSQRYNGPTTGTYGSRIMVMTLPEGSTKWTVPFVADSTSPTATTYGHQFMPSLNFAFGKMMLAWFDSRRDNLENVLACVNPPAGGQCTDLSQLTPEDQPIPGSSVATPSTVFTPLISDPNSGIRHTIDVFGGMIDPSGGPATFKGFQISQYAYWVNGQDNNQIEQGFFNPPNLPMFVQGTTPFIGDYIDIAAQSIMPSGNSWAFNTQAKDPNTGATNAPDFHITWTDNRDVVPPPVVNGNQDWTQYQPPNSGQVIASTYTSGGGAACPTCQTTQPVCTTVTNPDGTPAGSYSGDRNQNVYTSRVTNGLVVHFAENAKPLSNTIPRSFSLLVKDTLSPLSTVPPGASSYFRIMLGVTAVNQTPTCNVAGGGMATLPGGVCYLDVAITPKTTLTQPITITGSTSANASVNVLVAQTNCVPMVNVSTGPVTCSNNPTATGLQSFAVINGDPSNPTVVNADQVASDNSDPDVETPYGTVPIVSGEEYNPVVDAPATDTNNTPKIGVPVVFTPQIVSAANNTPKINTESVFTPQINTPKIFSVQVVNPTIVDTINTPKINTPKINTPKIVSPDIFTPQITDLSDATNPIKDFTWKVANLGNTTATYNTTEFVKNVQNMGISCCPASCASNPSSCQKTGSNPAGPNCSVCQLIQHKVYESPTANRDAGTGAATCDLNVQQETIVESNIPSPAFSTSGVGSPTDPTSTLSISPGVGKRVTLRVVNPTSQNGAVSNFKTSACSYNNDNVNGVTSPACSLTIGTSTLPVAIVGQSYSASLSSNGGLGATAWSVPADPTNPVAAILPISPEPIGTGSGTSSNYLLSQAGQITATNVTDAPGTYFPFNAQVQDSAAPASLDVQQLQLLVNHFSITSVDVAISNEVGSIGYMKSGDIATVTATISNLGPATASSIAPTISVTPTLGGTQVPAGSPPSVSCTGPTPVLPQIGFTLSSNTSGNFAFTCTAAGGNGYVTFTANATAQYANAPAPTSNAIAVAVVVPPTTDGIVSQVVVDNVPPTLAFGATTSHTSAPGWYNAPVIVPFTTADNLSGVASAVATAPATSSGVAAGSMTLTTEGMGVTGTMTVTDYAHNTALPFTSTGYNIDETAPIITGSRAPLANGFGWNNTSVTATFSCNDPNPKNGPAGQQSGIFSCTTPIVLAGEGTNQSATGTAVDNAANSSQFTVNGINIDETAPLISAVPTPLAPNGNNGWYVSPVTTSFNCTDPNPLHGTAGQQSGIATCSAPVQLSSDGAAQSVPGQATDKAGNATPINSAPVNIDQTPPAITASSTYTAGVWTNQSVVVQFACTDNLSGPAAGNPIITGVPPLGSTLSYSQNGLTSTATVTLTANTPAAGVNFSAACQDVAGNNAAPAAFGPILIDTAAPVVMVTATAGGNPYSAGTWTNQSVVVNVMCTDALSGVKPGSISGNANYSAQGTYNVTGTCQDIAGNTGSLAFGSVLIDTTMPVSMITSPVTQTYLLKQTITPAFTCGDNSGGDTTTCTASPSAAPYEATAVGPATFSVHAVDQAGNATSPDPSVNYLVVYNFTGFQAPLQPAVLMNPPNPPVPPQPSDSGSFTIGNTVPVAFQLQDANNVYISDLTQVTSIVAIPNPACSGTAAGAGTILYNSATNQAALSYDAVNNRFAFSWNTTGMPAGCESLVVTLADTTQWSTIVHLSTDQFTGFNAPLTGASAPANPSNSGAFSTGSAIPVTFQLSIPNGGFDVGQNVTLSNLTVYANAACVGAPPSGSASTVLSDGSPGSYTFDSSTALYTVNWNTSGTPVGCYNIVATLSDQSVYATIVSVTP